MKKRERPIEDYTLDELRDYRIPKEAVYIYSYVSSIDWSKTKYVWWGCPRCRAVIEQDGQEYCGSCGQRISWKNFYKNCR